MARITELNNVAYTSIAKMDVWHVDREHNTFLTDHGIQYSIESDKYYVLPNMRTSNGNFFMDKTTLEPVFIDTLHKLSKKEFNDIFGFDTEADALRAALKYELQTF